MLFHSREATLSDCEFFFFVSIVNATQNSNYTEHSTLTPTWKWSKSVIKQRSLRNSRCILINLIKPQIEPDWQPGVGREKRFTFFDVDFHGHGVKMSDRKKGHTRTFRHYTICPDSGRSSHQTKAIECPEFLVCVYHWVGVWVRSELLRYN